MDGREEVSSKKNNNKNQAGETPADTEKLAKLTGCRRLMSEATQL